MDAPSDASEFSWFGGFENAMARNRKNQAAEIRFGPVLKVVLLCSLIGGSAIGYVWQKSQIDHLGRQIAEREIKLKQLKNDNKLLSDQIAFLHSPVMLDRRAKDLNLGLAPAQPLQVVRLVDVPAAVEDDSRQFAQRPVAGGTP
jgi:cell division protein FtsB